VSLHVGTILDVEDFIHSSYTLEVSSPGLERGLYRRADYERFAGSLAKVKTRKPIEGQRNFRGRLLGLDGEDVLLEDRTSGRVRVPLDSIAKANLEMDIEAEFRRTQGR
jgi:ribosome maturation factor RimP